MPPFGNPLRRCALLFIFLLAGGRGSIWAAATPDAGAELAKVVEPFLEQHCNRCHNEKKHKGEFRIDNLSRDFLSGKSVLKWAEVMDKISSGEMPPEEEDQPKAGEAARIVEWLAGKIKEGETVRLAKRERVTFSKLTRDEYVNTIRDLLGVGYDATDPIGLSEDEAWHGFERIGSVLSLSPSHVEKHFAAGEAILAEALPEKPPVKFLKRKTALDLRGGAADKQQLWADKVRVDLWPGAELQGGRAGPGQALPISGFYKVRIQLSGLKPKEGRAPHLAVYATDLDRMLFEQDIVTPEDQPVIVEFTAHLPAGNLNLSLANDVPGPSNLPRSGRADPRVHFFSVKDGRRPWQTKLTDEEGRPLRPFLILDWVEWEGPLGEDGPTLAQREYLPKESGNVAQARAVLAKFAERAYRRPVKSEEVEQLVKLVESEMASGEKFEAAVKTALLAVLCAKDFLYLVEGSPERPDPRLNDWELASRLSYFLWSTMPDAPWDAILDEAKWGTPSPAQVAGQHWDWKLDDAQWREVVAQKGEGKKEDVKFDFWLPEDIGTVRGIVVISGHGSGENLYRHPELRKIARELHLALFKFVGNPMQRGFWPRSLLHERLQDFGQKAQRPELANAPLFLYGHSNGTGFSAVFTATEGARVWAWVSMRPGTTSQVYQPGAAPVPGMIIFGEDDGFFARPSKEQNMAVVEAMRKKHDALWHYAVEPRTGHGPGEKTWPLVFSFLRHSFAARVPADGDPRQGPVKLATLHAESGYLGQNWNATTGGYQTLPIAPCATFTGEKSTASWLLNAAYAAAWQTFQRDGQLTK